MNISRRIFNSPVLPSLLKATSTSESSQHGIIGILLKRNLSSVFQTDKVSKINHRTEQQRLLSNTSSDDVSVVYKHGLPVITLVLPSRHEKCSFTLRPLMSTVGEFLENLKAEDKGIDRTAIYSQEGVRVASSTQIEHLLSDSFRLSINDETYTVTPPPIEKASESIHQLDDMKRAIAQLYTSLQVDHYCLQQEQEAMQRLEDLRFQLEPLEKAKFELEKKANSRTNLMMWGGLAFMATQFGVLARLTWWEYSWDIMEPVTYFITYGTAMCMYGYFLLTKQEYIYPDARDRQYLRFFHKAADSTKFDVMKYNSLHERIDEAKRDLKRIQEPLKAISPIKAKHQSIEETD